jgi:hypothetical protein
LHRDLTSPRCRIEDPLTLKSPDTSRTTAALTVASFAKVQPMQTELTCPCGERIVGKDEDDLVEKAQKHLKEKHPGHEYTREEILFIAN